MNYHDPNLPALQGQDYPKETKTETFTRLATARVNAALEKIHLLTRSTGRITNIPTSKWSGWFRR